MLDSSFLKAQFESSMKFIEWAVSKCVQMADPALMKFMRRQLIEQVKFLERNIPPEQPPAKAAEGLPRLRAETKANAPGR